MNQWSPLVWLVLCSLLPLPTPGFPLQQYEHTLWVSGVEVWNWDSFSSAEKILLIRCNNEVVCLKIQLCHVFCVFFIGLAHPHLSDRRWDVLWEGLWRNWCNCVHPAVSTIAWKWLTVTRKELRNFSLLNYFFFFFSLKMYLNSFSSSWAEEFKCLSDHWVDSAGTSGLLWNVNGSQRFHGSICHELCVVILFVKSRGDFTPSLLLPLAFLSTYQQSSHGASH